MDSKVQIERMQNDKVVRTMNGLVGYQPTIDGNDNERSLPGFLQDDPRNVIKNGTFKIVPLLTGIFFWVQGGLGSFFVNFNYTNFRCNT